jgi:hypothetical protein
MPTDHEQLRQTDLELRQAAAHLLELSRRQEEMEESFAAQFQQLIFPLTGWSFYRHNGAWCAKESDPDRYGEIAISLAGCGSVQACWQYHDDSGPVPLPVLIVLLRANGLI